MTLPLFTASVGIAIYLLVPGPSQSLLGSWPLSPVGVVALVVAVGSAWLATLAGRERTHAGWVAAIGVLIAARVMLGVTEAPSGWLARYYANADWSGQPEWSSAFRFTDSTRIDDALSFTGSEFPTHYLNGPRFVSGFHREVIEPMSVEWQGAFSLASAATVPFAIRANGSASVAFDDAAAYRFEAQGSAQHQLSAGRHVVTVRYAKAANTEAAFHLEFPFAVVPPNGSPRSPLMNGLATGLDALVVVVLLVASVQSLRAALASTKCLQAIVGAALGIVLGTQGLIVARPHLTTFKTLSGGDDWLGFESRARDVLQNGLLMTLGRPIGEGDAYFYHPFYSYILAATHAVAGESLFGPVLMQFLVLAITGYLMWTFARDAFGTQPATYGLVALLAVFEVDFIRYYTVTLLSENVYILFVTLCLRAFASWTRSGATRALVQAGCWAGLAAATRPAMMMFFGPALLIAALVAMRKGQLWSAARAAAIVAASWLAVVAPFTLRNWIVSRKLVLISDSLGAGFIVYTVPPPVDPSLYLSGYGGGIVNSAAVLWRIFWDQPAAFVSWQVEKLGFTLGMVHWFDGYRPHPELIAITVLYLLMLMASPMLRSQMLWPVHAFVVAHVVSMGLTIPWNYGYRLILPPFVYTSTFAVAAAVAWLRPALASPPVAFAGERS